MLQLLEETQQIEACRILQKIPVHDDQVQQLLNLPVKVFGRNTELKMAFPNFTNEDARKILKDPEARKEFCKIVSTEGDVPNLDGTLPEQHSCYIPRFISNRFVIDPVLFKKECNDVFVFEGIPIFALKKLVGEHRHVTSSSTEQGSVTKRYIYLDDEEDWDDMVAISYYPIHWIYKENDHYVLKRTTHVTDILRCHEKNQFRSQDAYISEDDFTVNWIFEPKSNCAIICDVPGMGKSLLLENLARSIRCRSPDVLVFYIQLSSFSKFLADKPPSHESELNIVVQYASASRIAWMLLEPKKRKNNTKVFILDGFDEIRGSYLDQTTRFLENLSKECNVKLLISSRPHMRSHLEQTFGVISYDILPFGTGDQVKAMVGFWLQKWPDRRQKILREFALRCITYVKKIQTPEYPDILGVPLKCYILAEVNERRANRVSSLNHRKYSLNMDEMVSIGSIARLYEIFIETSLLKLESNHFILDAKHKIATFHTFKALELLLPDVAKVYKCTLSLDTNMRCLVKKAGIMYYTDKDELQFVHPSFAQFFVGNFFADFWINVGEHEPQYVKTVGICFFKNILQTSNCRDMQLALTTMLRHKYLFQVDHEQKVAKFSSSHAVLLFMHCLYRCRVDLIKQQNCAELFKKAVISNEVSLTSKELARMMEQTFFDSFEGSFGHKIFELVMACVEERFDSLLSLIAQVVKSLFVRDEICDFLTLFNRYPVNIIWPLLLNRIATNGRIASAQEVLNLFGTSNDNILLKVCREFPAEYISPLEIAIHKNDLNMAVFFGDKINPPWQNLVKQSLVTDKGIVEDDDIWARVYIINQFDGLLDRISAMFRNESIEKYFTSIDCVSCYDINIRIIICLASQKNLNLNLTCRENKAILLGLGMLTNDEELLKLLILLFGKYEESANAGHSDILCPQTWDLSSVRADRVLLALDKKEALSSIMHMNASYYSFEKLQNIETLKLLIGICPDISPSNYWQRNYLHYACQQGKVEWAKFLIDFGYDVNQFDIDGDTPLLWISVERALELTKLLAENKANIYAVNRRKDNFLHCVLQKCGPADSDIISEWVTCTLQIGCDVLWKMPNKQGITPLEIVYKILGSHHPTFLSLMR